MTKFKKGDILIQYARGRAHADILKVISATRWGYKIEFVDGDYCKFVRDYIENGSPVWHPARYLTDEEKVEWL